MSFIRKVLDPLVIGASSTTHWSRDLENPSIVPTNHNDCIRHQRRPRPSGPSSLPSEEGALLRAQIEPYCRHGYVPEARNESVSDNRIGSSTCTMFLGDLIGEASPSVVLGVGSGSKDVLFLDDGME